MTENQTSSSIFTEIYKEVMRIVRSRKLKRDDVFDKRVSAPIETLEEIHSDFLIIISSLKIILNDFSLAVRHGKNLSGQDVTQLEQKIAELAKLTDRRRAERRRFFELCLARYEELNLGGLSAQIQRQTILTMEEHDILCRYYEELLRYFRRDDHSYSHGVRANVAEMRNLVHRFSIEGDSSILAKKISGLTNDLEAQELQFEHSWSVATRVYAKLEARLG
ncbi:MAG: hypothetical protein ABJP66_00530 [Hyphomicrobiales bacterium]